MQLIYLTFVLRKRAESGKKMVYGNIIRILTNKIFPIEKLKAIQTNKTDIPLLDLLEYMKAWRSEFKYLIPKCCDDNFCLIISNGNDTLFSCQIGWEVKEEKDVIITIRDSWNYMIPFHLMSRDYINYLTVKI